MGLPPPKKETECVCNANIHSEGRKIMKAVANLLAPNCSEESQSDCREASVRNLCVVTMVTNAYEHSEAVSDRNMSNEAAASSVVGQQVCAHISELQPLQSHSDAAYVYACVLVNSVSEQSREGNFHTHTHTLLTHSCSCLNSSLIIALKWNNNSEKSCLNVKITVQI